jgi:hypothetical protein
MVVASETVIEHISRNNVSPSHCLKNPGVPPKIYMSLNDEPPK